ncbi:upf0301 protein cag_1601 [Phtheirospermum japonicum]|uniref:Upf0301 protein cag_1601 n=1 Tax=Phtheirospermum japonicum TaxID=374723 RepID=A0A830B2B2_9LAMI|nr:upf0301 protein cag_1601 [Phtheirospermum japonicum]
MDLCCVRAKSTVSLLRNSFPDKPICWDRRNNQMALEIRVSKNDSFSNCYRYRSVLIRSMAKKSSGNSNGSSSSSSSNSDNDDHSRSGEDGLKGSNKPDDTGSTKSKPKSLNWREFRSLLYIQEQAENADSTHIQDKPPPGSKPTLPLKWAHPIITPENGCLLLATRKLDGVGPFERSVILLLKSGTNNPQEGPFGVIINRPLHKKMKHMNPTNAELATTFADCSLYYGGPLDASMFLLRDGETRSGVLSGFEGVMPGLCFGSRTGLDEASRLVKEGTLDPRDMRIFMGYAGWQMDQLRAEIEGGFWYVAACSANLIFGGSQSVSSSGGLWQEVLKLMGGHYPELSRKPNQDV